MGMVLTRADAGTGIGEPFADPLRTALPPAARLLPVTGEALLAAIVAAVTSLTVHRVVGALPIPVPSFVPLALSSLGAALVLGVVLAMSVRSLHARWPRWATPLTWVALSILSSLTLTLMLVGSEHYIFGVSGDQGFRVQYLSRFVASPRLADMAYADVPPYYPAGWFWVGGRIAALTGTTGWEAYQPYAIATMAVSGVLASVAWSLVVRRPSAALLALVTTVVGLRVAAYEPYSWLLGAVLPPLAVLAWRLMRAAAAGRSPRRCAGTAVLLGVVLGSAGMVYTLLFGFLGFVLVAMALAALRAEPTGGRPAAAGRLAGTLALLGGVALPLVLVVWTPFLLGVLEHGYRAGAAQRFLPEVGAAFPIPMTEFSVSGLLTLIGTVWIVLRWRHSTVAQALGALALAGYAWFALSTLALAVGTTLLAFRVEPAIVAALACAGVLGVRDGFRTAARRISGMHIRSLTMATALISFAAVLSLVRTVPEMYEWSREASYGDYYPDGTPPIGPVDEAEAGAWNDELLATVDDRTARPPQDLVVLSTHQQLLTYRPYFAFQAAIDQYANPLADFPARRAEIERWAASRTPADLLAAMDAGRFTPPSVFVLRREVDGLHLTVTYDRFPEEPNVGSYEVVFRPTLFDHPVFTRRDTGPFTVIVRGPLGSAR